MGSNRLDKNREKKEIAGGVSQKRGVFGKNNAENLKNTPKGVSTKGSSYSQSRRAAENTDAAPRRSKFLTVFICAFLSVVIIFGAVIGIIMAVRGSDAVVSGEGVYVSEGAANYFASQYKVIYLGNLKGQQISDAADTEEFWNKDAGGGKTYGEKFLSAFKSYLSEIVAGNVLFNKFATLTVLDERIIENTIGSVLRDSAQNSIEIFDNRAAKYGFNYEDFCDAAELQYKYDMAKVAIYGEGGESLDQTLASRYYKKYTHVSLAYIRTDFQVEKDAVSGAEIYTELTAAEKEELLKTIESYKTLIDNKKNGSGEMMTGSSFDKLMKDHDGDSRVYFQKDASETKLFALSFPEVVELAYSMKNGEFAYVDCSLPKDDSYRGFEGVYFIYKTEGATAPYEDKTNPFFADFYSNAAKYYFAENIVEYSKDAEFTDLYDEVMRPLSIPKNNEIYIAGWVS